MQHEINSPSQFANDNILFLKDATDGFIKKLNQAPDAPDEADIEFFKENAPEAVEQAAEGISENHNHCEIDEKFAYRDAESAKRNNDLNQAIRSTQWWWLPMSGNNHAVNGPSVAGRPATGSM